MRFLVTRNIPILQALMTRHTVAADMAGTVAGLDMEAEVGTNRQHQDPSAATAAAA